MGGENIGTQYHIKAPAISFIIIILAIFACEEVLSQPSNTILDHLIPPIPPSNLSAHTFDGFVELSWSATESDIVVHYKIYRRMISVKVWEVIATFSVGNNNQGEYIFYEACLDKASFYEYAVTAVDLYGNESSFSKIIKVEINH